jgi:hypothetical protein
MDINNYQIAILDTIESSQEIVGWKLKSIQLQANIQGSTNKLIPRYLFNEQITINSYHT